MNPNVEAAEKSTHGHGPEFVNGLFDCFSPFDTCLIGTCCPCFLFGKTQARMRGEAHPSSFDFSGDCCGWYALAVCAGMQWILQCSKRGEMRSRFNISGGGFTDCLTSWCCHCCALIQEEKESLLRIQGVDAKTGQQYQAPSGMSYQA